LQKQFVYGYYIEKDSVVDEKKENIGFVLFLENHLGHKKIKTISFQAFVLLILFE